MTRDREWYKRKALACVTAWQHRYCTNPTKRAICLVCAVALHETDCGDAWGGSGNFGAIQRRIMTPDERQIVKEGGKPMPRDDFEELHGDSSPITGKYSTWFWRFPAGIVYPPADLAGDAAGAWKLLEVLLDERPRIKEGIDVMSPETLALLMYESHYYEGFHDPRLTYFLVNGRWTPETKVPAGTLPPNTPKRSGKDLNVDDYARALRTGFTEFSSNVDEWGFRSPAVLP